MLEDFPASFVTLDASRPWMMYWAANALAILGEDVTAFRKRAIATASAMQNTTGGFGGGHGQYSHAAPSYAAVLMLALVGGGEAYDLIDRPSFWRWAASLKQRDGGFSMSVGGEEDIRGAYCIMTCISLLSLPMELPDNCQAKRWGMETFTDGLAEYISRCQTYEGGISGTPGSEAHGAYTFCGLACLSILGPPHLLFPRYLDLPLLIDWLSSKQLAPEGGFAGRTNKLVDGCYSHWAGGCWPLIEAALRGGKRPESAEEGRGLYDRQGLARWVLNCCQEVQFGLLKDKVGKPADAYHTNYNLAGLSSMQWRAWYVEGRGREGKPETAVDADGPEWETDDEEEDLIIEDEAAYRWKYEPVPCDGAMLRPGATIEEVAALQAVWREEDRLVPIHPVFVIGHQAVVNIRRYFDYRNVHQP